MSSIQMSSLLSLIDASLLKEHTQIMKKTSKLDNVASRPTVHAAKNIAGDAMIPIDGQAPGPLDSVSVLKKLVDVAKEIGRMDEMLARAEADAPKCAEALKWHEVSVRALEWSRNLLAREQCALLQRMKEQALANQVWEPEAESSPIPALGPLRSDLTKATSDVAPASNPAGPGSLRSDLKKLWTYDKERCLLVRNIKKLGLESAEKLRVHFSAIGGVSEVLVAHSFEKPSAKRRNGRMRPAAMGFVVMEDATVAQHIANHAAVQLVRDGSETLEVVIQKFDPEQTYASE